MTPIESYTELGAVMSIVVPSIVSPAAVRGAEIVLVYAPIGQCLIYPHWPEWLLNGS